MITKSIAPYIKKYSYHTPSSPVILGNGRRWDYRTNTWVEVESHDRPAPIENKRPIIRLGKSPNEMSKMEFDMYVGNLKQKIGDYLVSKFTPKPYKANQVHKLIYINEMHKFVESWAVPEVGPLIFTLQGVNPNSQSFKGGANMWNKVELADLPEEWKRLDNITE